MSQLPEEGDMPVIVRVTSSTSKLADTGVGGEMVVCTVPANNVAKPERQMDKTDRRSVVFIGVDVLRWRFTSSGCMQEYFQRDFVAGSLAGDGGTNGLGSDLAGSVGWTLATALMVIRGIFVEEVFKVIWAWALPGSNGGAAEMVN